MQNTTRDALLQEILERYKHKGSRKLIGLAGAPGSGKSTLASWLVESLNTGEEGEIATVFAQDAFHYDDHVLKQRNRLARKGAEDTFDVNGLYATLNRILIEPKIAVPVFDREVEISRNAAKVIEPNIRVVIVEGNYLLMQKPSCWFRLRQLFDMTIILHVPHDTLEQRLLARWLSYGYSQKAAEKKVLENDMPNAVTVMNNSAGADWVLT